MSRAAIRSIRQMVEIDMGSCYVCNSEAKLIPQRDHEFEIVRCPRCGEYEIEFTAQSLIKSSPFDNATASGWIREQNSRGMVPQFNTKNLETLLTLQKPSFRERAERLLLAAVEKSPNLQATFNVKSLDLVAASYSSDFGEISIIAKYLEEEGWLENPKVGGGYAVAPRGHIAADELRTRRAQSSQAFVAMWFAPEMKPIYDNGLSIGIGKAGYKPMRVDQKEHANKIDDEIIAEIRRSAFVVADFTDHRGGVYFESGFAMGLGLPVIWTCRKDHMEKLHFDIRQYNCIDWSNADELARRLQYRIERMLGRGPINETGLGQEAM